MKVLVNGKEEERAVDHREQRAGFWVDVPVTYDNEQLIWTVSESEPQIITIRERP